MLHSKKNDPPAQEEITHTNHMNEKLEQLILDRLQDELGFLPTADEARQCVDCAQDAILKKLLGMLSDADWKEAAGRYEFPR